MEREVERMISTFVNGEVDDDHFECLNIMVSFLLRSTGGHSLYVSLNLIRMCAAVYEHFFNTSVGEKFERILDQRRIG